MTRRPYDPTPEQKARAQLSTQPGLAVLSDAQPETLLDTYAALTHRIHEAERHGGWNAADQRAQRDLIRTEVLRRMAGVR